MASEQITGELGSSYPAASQWTEVYNVPNVTGDYMVTSLIAITNLGNATDYYRLAIITHSGGTPSNQQIRAYDVPLPPNKSDYLAVPFTLGPNQALAVYARNGTLSFGVSGVQNV